MIDKNLSPDYVMRMEKQKIYKAKNKGKIKAYQAEWRKKNPIDKETKSLINKLNYEKTKRRKTGSN